MSERQRWFGRVLAKLGLDLDFSVSLESEPLSRVRSNLFVGRRPAPTPSLC